MKTIKDPEYQHIKRLLESTNEDDVLIGLNLLKKADFSTGELLRSFPKGAVENWDFYNKSDLTGKVKFPECTLLLNDMWIFAIPSGENVGDYYKILDI